MADSSGASEKAYTRQKYEARARASAEKRSAEAAKYVAKLRGRR